MAYGFEVKNATGDIVANDTDFNWALYHEGTVTISAIGDSATLMPQLTAASISEPMPLVFFRAPASRRIILLKMDKFLSGGLYYWAPRLYLKNSDTSASDPLPVTIEYRIYRPTNYVTYSGGTTYGLIVYDSNGNKTFDSRMGLATISQVLTLEWGVYDGNQGIGVLQTTTTYVAPGSGTPWLSSTDVYEASSYKGMWYTGSARYYFDSYYTNINNGVVAGYTWYTTNITSGSPQYWNNNSGKTHKCLIMSGTSTPLTAWINKDSGGTSSCTASSGSCTTSETYWSQWTGGNSNYISGHSWQLVGGNASSFTLSYPYSNGVTVTLNAGAGTYTTTLRYTLSQPGSTSVVIDTPISRTHTSGYLVSPMVGVPNTSWSSADTQYNSGTASTTTKIWMTNDGQIWIQEGTYAVRNGAPTSAWWSGATYVFGGGVANIGASYWVRFTRTGTTGSTSASTGTTGWLSLASDQSVSVSASQSFGAGGVVQNSATYTIEVASTSSGGSPISTTTNITISASADSVNTPEP